MSYSHETANNDNKLNIYLHILILAYIILLVMWFGRNGRADANQTVKNAYILTMSMLE